MQTESQIFPPTTGGAKKMASDMGVPFLGRLPLDPRIGKCCDEGKSFLREVPDSPAAKAYAAVIQGMSSIRHPTYYDCLCIPLGIIDACNR